MPDSRFRVRAVMLIAVALVAVGCSIPDTRTTPDTRTEQERAADRALADQVVAALRADPYTDADHLTVHVKRGAVRLTGQVGDESTLRSVLRICAAVPGVQRVDDELEIIDFGRTRR
ncbi:MAG TPA: BON domain-containing protein [Burkholderiaceae bacterium]|nr:BON domain-containing protein [Burkholderiaceae bacterium]